MRKIVLLLSLVAFISAFAWIAFGFSWWTQDYSEHSARMAFLVMGHIIAMYSGPAVWHGL